MISADFIRSAMVRCARILGSSSARRKWIGLLAVCAIPLTALAFGAVPKAATDEIAPDSVDARAGLLLTAGFRPDPPMTGDAFVGNKRCRMCHQQWHDSWQKRPHARAFNALKPGNRRETKRKANLDPNLDYTTDSRCLACHSVGFGRPGGYTIPVSEDGKTRRAASVRQAVGCESCHGPGGGFVQVMKQIDRKMRSYDIKELNDAGLNMMSPDICRSCHNTEALCVEPGYKFDPATMDGDSFHDHFRLQFRREARTDRSGRPNGTK